MPKPREVSAFPAAESEFLAGTNKKALGEMSRQMKAWAPSVSE